MKYLFLLLTLLCITSCVDYTYYPEPIYSVRYFNPGVRGPLFSPRPPEPLRGHIMEMPPRVVTKRGR